LSNEKSALNVLLMIHYKIRNKDKKDEIKDFFFESFDLFGLFAI
jgi:hypothetical protein